MSGWFEGVVGHQRVIDLLERELVSPANAYLFVGATAVGKATVARHFATALLCPVDDPECNICRRARAGAMPCLTSRSCCEFVVHPHSRPSREGGKPASFS